MATGLYTDLLARFDKKTNSKLYKNYEEHGISNNYLIYHVLVCIPILKLALGQSGYTILNKLKYRFEHEA